MHVIKILILLMISSSAIANSDTFMRSLYDRNQEKYNQNVDLSNFKYIDVKKNKDKEIVLKNKTFSFGIGFSREVYEKEEGLLLEKISPNLLLSKDFVMNNMLIFGINGSLTINNLLLSESAKLKLINSKYIDVGAMINLNQKIAISSQKNGGFLSYQYGAFLTERLFSLTFDQMILFTSESINFKMLISKENIGLYLNNEIIEPLDKKYKRDQYESFSGGLFFKF